MYQMLYIPTDAVVILFPTDGGEYAADLDCKPHPQGFFYGADFLVEVLNRISKEQNAAWAQYC
jgi:hypothetical protein